MTDKSDVLIELVKNHKQFVNKSNAYDEIVRVTGCNLSRARELVATHCNMISLWAILCARGVYLKNYGDFFKWCLGMKYCDIHGYIHVNKRNILDSLDVKSTFSKYREYEDVINPSARLDKNKFYQVKIFADTEGDHFLSAFIKDGIFYGVDTSYRGTPFIFTDKVPAEKYQWIMEVV